MLPGNTIAGLPKDKKLHENASSPQSLGSSCVDEFVTRVAGGHTKPPTIADRHRAETGQLKFQCSLILLLNYVSSFALVFKLKWPLCFGRMASFASPLRLCWLPEGLQVYHSGRLYVFELKSLIAYRFGVGGAMNAFPVPL